MSFLTNLESSSQSSIALTLAVAVISFLVAMPLVGRVANRRRSALILQSGVGEILDALPTGVMILDHRGCVVSANLAVCRMMGITRDRIMGRAASSLSWICSRDHSKATDPWHKALDSLVPPDDQWMRYQTPNGPVRTLSVHASLLISPERRPPSILVHLQDVTDGERRTDDRERMVAVLKQDRSNITRRNRQLQRLASTDPLTGCLNRRSFFAKFDSVWTANLEESGGVSALMIDIDHFKLLNDTYGHDFGDEVLRKVSKTLREAFDSPGIVCRYGGEEFCVLLPGFELCDAARVAEAVREVIEQLRFDADKDLVVTISTGVSDTKYGATTPVELIGQADRCLYDAKAHGRNQVTTFAELTSHP